MRHHLRTRSLAETRTLSLFDCEVGVRGGELLVARAPDDTIPPPASLSECLSSFEFQGSKCCKRQGGLQLRGCAQSRVPHQDTPRANLHESCSPCQASLPEAVPN